MDSEEENSLPLLQSTFPQGNIAHEAQLGNDGLSFLAYQIPPDASAEFQPQHPIFANWNDELSLIGYDISGSEFKAGDTITVNLYFQPLTDMSAKYTAYIHQFGAVNPETGSPVWAQVDREPCFQSYPTSWWREGEIIRDTFHLTLAPDSPAWRLYAHNRLLSLAGVDAARCGGSNKPGNGSGCDFTND